MGLGNVEPDVHHPDVDELLRSDGKPRVLDSLGQREMELRWRLRGARWFWFVDCRSLGQQCQQGHHLSK